MNIEISRMIEAGREREAVFALECLASDRHGELPENWVEALPAAVLENSPILLRAYARELLDEGDLGAARKLLESALKGFARQTVAKDLLSSFALLALVQLRLGGASEAQTALRFLAEELAGAGREAAEHQDEIHPDVLFALGRGGSFIGVGVGERSRHYERAALLYLEQDNVKRSLETLLEWVRLAVNAGNRCERSPGTLQGIVAQRSKWDPRYAAHRAVLELLQGPLALDHMVALHHTLAHAPLGSFYRQLARILTLRIRISLGQSCGMEEIRRLREEITGNYAAEIELHGELCILTFGHLLENGDASGAGSSLRELEALLSIGLPTEYEQVLQRMCEQLNSQTSGEPQGQKTWFVHCFGAFRLESKGVELRSLRWKRKKAQELFLYLLLRTGFSAPKETAVDVLFVDADPDKSSNQLYVILHEVKRVLQDVLGCKDITLIRDGIIRLPEGYIEEVDVEKYDTLIRVADQLFGSDPELSKEMFKRAVELYQTLLPDIQFIDWVDRLRDELEQKQIRALRKLYELSLGSGDFVSAEHFCRQWCEIAPLDEEAYQALLRILMESGRMLEAKKIYNHFEKTLYMELKTSPLKETKHICFPPVRNV